MDNAEFYKSMLDNMYDGVYFVDKDRKITFWNKGAEIITGFAAQEVINQHCYDNILNHADNNGTILCFHGCPMKKTIEDGVTRSIDVFLQHKNGHRVPISVRAIPIYDNGEIIGAVEIFKDISENHKIFKNLEELKLLAMRDQLTGLPNRRYIDTMLESKMNEYKTLGINFGIIFIDIDFFKNFNDTYGHLLGDEALKMVAKNFSGIISDSDLIGRWGGEEFIAVLSGTDAEKLYNIAEKIRLMVMQSSVKHREENLQVTISLGATMVNSHDTIESVVQRADRLLYQSKANGRNKVTIDM